MKKFLAIFLALACVLGLCACGGGGGNSSSGGGMTADGKVKLSIGLPSSAVIMSHDENALTKWIEEKCGVEITFVEYAGGTDISAQITTAVAARQELPDILLGMYMNNNTIFRYGQDGYFANLKDYFADKEGKSKIFWDRITNELSESDQKLIINTITDPDGSGGIYTVPTVETSIFDKQKYQTYINVQWLDKLGLEKPTDVDSLYKVLKAFKDNDCNGNGDPDDEIPLLGSELGGLGADVLGWLINLFIYYNDSRAYTVQDDGKLVATYTTDEYRKALQFINKLYKEGLLNPLAWTASGDELGNIYTPTQGTALVGLFCGHLSVQPQEGNDVLFEYEPLPMIGCAVRGDMSVSMSTYITEDCDNVDKAFEVLMTLWSWEGSMRMRYGEKGVNWDDPTPGAKSVVGMDATYKLISDPLGLQNACLWSKMCTFNAYAECETAELAQEMDEWSQKKFKMLAEHQAYFAEAEKNNNPEKMLPRLVYTSAERDQVEQLRTNLNDYRRECETDFCVGKMDPYSDAEWNAYLAELEKLGLSQSVAMAQVAYDRS